MPERTINVLPDTHLGDAPTLEDLIVEVRALRLWASQIFMTVKDIATTEIGLSEQAREALRNVGDMTASYIEMSNAIANHSVDIADVRAQLHYTSTTVTDIKEALGL